jgi:outer membrane biosynthesis protein TonB
MPQYKFPGYADMLRRQMEAHDAALNFEVAVRNWPMWRAFVNHISHSGEVALHNAQGVLDEAQKILTVMRAVVATGEEALAHATEGLGLNEPEPTAEPEPGSEPESEPEPGSEPESEPEPTAEPESEPEPKPKRRGKAAVVVTAEPESPGTGEAGQDAQAGETGAGQESDSAQEPGCSPVNE